MAAAVLLTVAAASCVEAAVAAPTASSLAPPALKRLPAGAIQPRGWLLDQALLQGNGMTGALGYHGGGISSSLWIDNDINGTGASVEPPPASCASTGADPREARGPEECPEGCVFVYGMRGEANTCTKDDLDDGLGAHEEQGGGYFLNGMLPLSCQADLPHLRALRDASIAKILKTVSPDGFLGPPLPNVTNGKNPDIYWGRMSLVLGLQSYVECEGPFAPAPLEQKAMEQALLKHHIAFQKHVAADSPRWTHDVWGSARYSEVLIAAQWLIDRGHTDPELFELMTMVRDKSEAVLDWQDWFLHGDPVATMTHFTQRCWGNKSDPTEHNWQKHHGVTIMEAIKTGAAWYRVSGNETDANNSAAAMAWVDRWSRGSDGTFTSPDCISEIPHLPSSGPETCSVVEEMYSLRHAYETTGDITLFDRLEFVAFNSMPVTTDRYWTGNSHYHAVNQIRASGTLGYNPFNGCCTGNVHQGWPKFIMSGVQLQAGTADTSGSTAAAAAAAARVVVSGYSPQEATLPDGTVVTIAGQYPFADNVTITITPKSAVGSGNGSGNEPAAAATPSLALRIPCWVDSAEVVPHAAATAATTVATAALPATPCSLYQVPADALQGATDTVTGAISLTLNFGHSIKILENKWHGDADAAPEAKFQHPVGAVEIRRGPLLFSFAVPSIENVTLLNGTCGVLCNKFKGMTTAMVRETVVVPDNTKPWQIALQDPNTTLVFGGFAPVSAVPFDHESPPATIKARAQVVHDKNPRGYAKGIVPDGPILASDTNGTVFDVELVPIGNTNAMRITVLPVLA